ncbi:MAG: DNA polymerase III subunit gamma/tau [Myxococcota bacterium]
MRLVNRVLPGDVKLFAPEGSAEGCASGECLPAAAPQPPPQPAQPPHPPQPPADLHEADEPEPPPPAPAQPIRSQASDDERWRRAVDAVRDASPRHGKSLSYARFLGMTPEGVKIVFPPDAAFHRSQITGMSRTMIEGELSKSLGRPVKLIEDTSPQALQSAPKSIAELEANDRSTRERNIADKVKMHPALRNVLKHLGGALEHITYLEPVARPPPAAAAPSADEGDGGPPVD